MVLAQNLTLYRKRSAQHRIRFLQVPSLSHAIADKVERIGHLRVFLRKKPLPHRHCFPLAAAAHARSLRAEATQGCSEPSDLILISKTSRAMASASAHCRLSPRIITKLPSESATSTLGFPNNLCLVASASRASASASVSLPICVYT